MGRRAKKAPVQTKKRATLAKQFKCPFCANEEVVECKMDFKASVGSLTCRLCAASYQMPIHHLHEPIDVFSEWLDDCEAAANGQRTGEAPPAEAPRFNDEEDEDDVPEAVEFNGRNNQKRPAQDTGARKKQKTGKAATITDLGLDDSDSDDED
ncbi:Transcription elongation factor 1 homolog [Seminavis robusta]|uniref:Transcription elongation factor 1 homolog n=1 Tax=Seminavis robusta TaxID=568900 RepID=A0A9N8DWT8_9STRA|nr:Transcription elongation factor 1 homolog [Seminavis robusta]|eukprot:Sro426_g140440.1 Transcription elongation factor 1 homolog (153) ;mRNA; r:36603-37206